MSGIDERIVREYFELNGFFVRQLRKYQVQSRPKRSEEEIDLLIYNPHPDSGGRKPNFIIFPNELPRIGRAVVFIKAWHSHRFSPGTLRSSADLLKFLEKDVIKCAEDLFAVDEDAIADTSRGPLYKILVLPGLPTHEPHKSQSAKMLEEAGLDGIISFRSILQDILAKVEINHNYGKSDLLQTLRVLKNYDLIKSPQMDLFSQK